MSEEIDVTQFIGFATAKRTLAKSRFAVVSVPYEKTVSYGGGTKNGPAAIIEASTQVELWDEETATIPSEHGICTLPPLKCAGPEGKVLKSITAEVEKLLASTEATPFFLGGEHTVTQALLPPFAKKYKNLSVLHFDAHADLRDQYEGTPHSHACALYPASKTMKVVQVGIRSVSDDECHRVNAGNVVTFMAHNNRDIKKLVRGVLKELSDNVYITIDVDGFDPSVIPATGTPQPGGFGWYEAMDLFSAVCKNKRVVGVDVVEVAPVKQNSITEFAAAKLIHKLMGYLLLSKKNRR